MGGNPPQGSLTEFAACRSDKVALEYLEMHPDFIVTATDSNGLTPLHHAVTSGFKGVTEALLKKGADMYTQDNFGQTPFHTAVRMQNKELVEIFLKQSVNVDAKNTFKETPLHLAVNSGNKEIVQMLLHYNADINTKNTFNETPLHLAVKSVNKDIVQVLLDTSVDIDAEDTFGTPYEYASRDHGQDETEAAKTIKKLLLDKAFKTALHCTSKEDAIKYLKRYSDIITSDEFFLHQAVRSAKNTFLIEAMLDRGADVNAFDMQCTPLHYAISRNEEDFVNVLLSKKGVAIDKRDRNEDTPLMLAVKMNTKPEIVRALLDKGADVTLEDKSRYTPLMLAVTYNGNPEIVQAFLEKDADVNVKNADDCTPLHLAIINGRLPEIVQALLKKDADVNALERRGLTPLYIAATLGQTDTVKILLKHRADVTSIPKDVFSGLSQEMQTLLLTYRVSCGVCNP